LRTTRAFYNSSTNNSKPRLIKVRRDFNLF